MSVWAAQTSNIRGVGHTDMTQRYMATTLYSTGLTPPSPNCYVRALKYARSKKQHIIEHNRAAGTTPNQHCITSVIRTKNWFELSPSAPENIFMRSQIGFLQNLPNHGRGCGGSASKMHSSEDQRYTVRILQNLK